MTGTWPGEGLADITQLLSHPPRHRRGSMRVEPLPNPGAGNPLTYVVGDDYWRRIMALIFTYTASSAAGLRVPLINHQTADGVTFDQTAAQQALNAGEAMLVSADVWFPGDMTSGYSLSNTGSPSSGPAAGTVLATLALPQGTWTVNWLVGLGGTTAPAEQDNFGLYLGATQIAVSQNSSSSGVNVQQLAQTVEVPAAGATLTIQNIAAGTSTAVYRATETASLAGLQASYPQIPDVIMRSGWQMQVTASGILSGDTITGAVITTERYASDWADGTLAADEEDILRKLARLIGRER